MAPPRQRGTICVPACGTPIHAAQNTARRLPPASSGDRPATLGPRGNLPLDRGQPAASRDGSAWPTHPQAKRRPASEYWWAVLDSNQRPKDYACHFGFRRPFPVRGLDSALPFGLPVESLHVLSCESFARRWHSAAGALAFTEFEKFYFEARCAYLEATHAYRPIPYFGCRESTAKSSALTD